jgi:hypothetical protein
MVIISIIFILLIEVKIPQLNQSTVGLFNFKITPAISGILFFVATGLFILNKLLKTRRTVLSFQSKSNIR